MKLKTIFLVLILGLAVFLPVYSKSYSLAWQGTAPIEEASSKNFEDSTSPNMMPKDQSSEDQIMEPDIAIIPTPLTNASWYYGGAIAAGQKHYYVLENVPFNSAKYKIQGYEWNPASQNIDVYVKFGEVPTTSDYDYKASTSAQFETVDVVIPKDDEYGDMYIMIYCVSGSGYESTWAHYVSDGNGCWRTADYIATPHFNDPPKTINDHVDATDLNDFFKVYLYSGQKFTIDAETIGLTYGVECYFYDEDHNLIASDTSGIWIDITYFITAFETMYYYIQFRNIGSTTHGYTADLTDDHVDNNNRYDDAKKYSAFNISGTGVTNDMNTNDVNDYWYFRADSGQKISITITIDDTLDSPYYDAYLYSTSNPINDDYVKYDSVGTTLTITYYCPEYYTSEVHGHGNLIYLRIWNAALHYGVPDVTSHYTISLTRSYDEANDRMSTAPSYTVWGNNSTPKYGDLTGEADNNDWFKISTKTGYTIKINFNASSAVPNPYLDGYLYDDSGALLMIDSNFNISITYTARYDGDYYFRLYEAAASYYYGSYIGSATYDWYIYTSAFDGNDNFTTAEYKEPPITILSTVSSADPDDFYQFEVPSGYEIELSGICNPDVQLSLYDHTEAELAFDGTSPWSITYHHTGLSTETFYAGVHNIAMHPAVDYELTISLNKIDPDGDGEMADATYVSLSPGDSDDGSDSIGGIDINDYYSFDSCSGDKILITVDGPDDLVTRIVKEDSSGNELTLVEEVIAGDPVTLEYFPNDFYPGDIYYLRVSAPDGVPSGSYDWNITRVEFDIEDGYMSYSEELESGMSLTIDGELSDTDTNDWFAIKLRSGERIDIDLASTMPAPHVGFTLLAGFYWEQLDNGTALHANYTNLDGFSMWVYIQVVNEAKVPGDYTLEISLMLIDDDNNGAPEIAENMPYDSNEVDELGIDDINDFYGIEINSGYNLTVQFNAYGFSGLPVFCALYDEAGTLVYLIVNTFGTLTFTNPEFEPFIGYVQFYNIAPLVGYNASASEGEYHWNATLVNDDPDGDFNKAITLTGPTEIVNDHMFANITFPSYNLSDINDFYKIDLDLGDVLSLSVSISGVTDPWFEVYVYDSSYNIVASATGSDAYDLIFNVGDQAGTYYIRLYNRALKGGDYTMAVSVSEDSDSYMGGATPVTPGPQTPDSMSDVDISDFYSIELQPGWRMKVNASVTGTTPDVDLRIYDPDELSVIADPIGTNYLEVEFSATKNGTYYIEFYNTGGTTVNYDWWIEVYEDENGVFATATSVGVGDINDDVQELDKFDYFTFAGIAGEEFTITCTLPGGLALEMYLYNSTEGLIDADTTPPGLALTYVPSSDETFYLLIANPTGDTGSYTFTVTGTVTSPGPTATPTGPTGGFFDFLNNEWLGLPIWVWIAIGAGALVVIIITTVVIVVVRKRRRP
ncbi:MAG: hypothetical protein GF308_06405 [Candidatus Heimdallarchaeota archaeon]|nr:hypothetical protein [Candidatus Heimdallarchaeota archaeon]